MFQIRISRVGPPVSFFISRIRILLMYHYRRIIHIKAVALLGPFCCTVLKLGKVLCMIYSTVHVDHCISTHDRMISIAALRVISIAALRMIW